MRRRGHVREYFADEKLAGMGCRGKEDRGLRITASPSHLAQAMAWIFVLTTETEIQKMELVWEQKMWGLGLDPLSVLWKSKEGVNTQKRSPGWRHGYQLLGGHRGRESRAHLGWVRGGVHSGQKALFCQEGPQPQPARRLHRKEHRALGPEGFRLEEPQDVARGRDSQTDVALWGRREEASG